MLSGEKHEDAFNIFAGSDATVFYFFLMLILSCGGENQATKEIPAQIENPVEETMLTTITLTEKAVQRLGIETDVAELKNLPGIVKSGGEVIAVPGHEAVVTAPISGTVFFAENNVSISAGMVVKKGQDIMRLSVMPSGNDLFLAREDMGAKETDYRVLLDKYRRSEQLLAEKAISEKAFQAVEAELANVQAALNSAKARLQVLDGSMNSTEGNLATLSIQSPIDGILQKISVASGQRITMSTPLFAVSGQNPVWIRVPVYVGDLQKIDMNRPAILHPMGDTVPGEMISVSPVQGPPLSDPVNASSELFFEVNNENRRFRIGDKVMVSLPKKTSGENIVIPFSAVVYDMHGGSWLYVKLSTLTYNRRRIEISHVIGSDAVIARGVIAGEEVVTAGVAELYGTEFGGEK